MITSIYPVKKEPVPPLVKVRDVAKLLSVSRHTVHNLIDCGDLDAKPINPTKPKRKGKQPRIHVRVTRESLLHFYKDRFGHPLEQALVNPFEKAA
jgi:hypothetical protein